MQGITRKEFLGKLDAYIEKNVKIKFTGYFWLEINFQKFNYDVKCDKLIIQDKINDNYLDINLNNINCIIFDSNTICCYFDDGRDSKIEIIAEAIGCNYA